MAVPVVEPKAGSCYVWVITAVLFICLSAGGTLLVIYMISPDSSSVASYPAIGISLVCLPWLFWFITFLYRLLSRKLGFHMVFWGATLDSLHHRSSTVGLPGGDETANSGVGGKEETTVTS
ncbi:hypothetical protein V2J09_000716 [Rumex salicifolius]